MAYRNYDPNSILWQLITKPQTERQPLLDRRLDLILQESCDCVISGDGYAAYQIETFSPFFPSQAGPGSGDGGDILAVTDSVVCVATQDGGGTPGVPPYGQLYYFVGPTGWVISGPDLTDTWNSTIAEITQSYGGPNNPIGEPSPAWTRYVIGYPPVPWSNGTRVETCLISEHYGAADPTQALEMERFVYAAGYGKIRWEEWSVGGTPAPNAALRAPAMQFCCPTPPLGQQNWVMTDVRTYTYIIPTPLGPPIEGILAPPGYYMAGCGWPSGFVLP